MAAIFIYVTYNLDHIIILNFYHDLLNLSRDNYVNHEYSILGPNLQVFRIKKWPENTCLLYE